MHINYLPSPAGFEPYAALMYGIPIAVNAKTIVETGLCEGVSTNIFLSSLSQLPGERTLHTYEINLEQEQVTRALRDIKNAKHRAKWELHEGDSIQGGKDWKGPLIDFLFLDSDHGEEFVENEIDAWIPHLSPNAIVCGDDIWGDYPESPDILSSAGRAFKNYIKKHPEWSCQVFRNGRGFIMMHRERPRYIDLQVYSISMEKL